MARFVLSTSKSLLGAARHSGLRLRIQLDLDERLSSCARRASFVV